MLKKTFFIGIVALSTLGFSAVAHAEQYYDQYPGNGFLPEVQYYAYYRSWDWGFIYHDDINDADYNCPVTFNVPEGSVYFIKSIGLRYKDNLTDGQIQVVLYRGNIFTGAVHVVAAWASGPGAASSSTQTASKGTEPGVKLVDTKKFVCWLNVFFFRDGDINPHVNLMIYQIRVHYGT